MRNDLTMIINSCDKFSDLWDIHVQLLEENWNDRGIRTIISTDKQTSKQYKNVEIISSKDGDEITSRLLYTLSKVDSEYILITLDDYFLTKKINTNDIYELVDYMKVNNVDYIRMFKRTKSKKIVFKNMNLRLLTLEQNYEVNLYPGLWKKSFLLKTIDKSLNAWQYEVSLTKKAKMLGAKCLVCNNNYFPILDVIRKGKLLRKANRYLKKKKLSLPQRELISRKEEIRIKIFTLGRRILPKKIFLAIKNKMIKSGRKFYSDGL